MFACLTPSPAQTRDLFAPRPMAARLLDVARNFSPRIEWHGEDMVVLDVDGLRAMFGEARAIGEALRRAAVEHGVQLRVALAATRTAAVLAVHGRPDALTVIPSGREAASLAPFPLTVLERVMSIQVRSQKSGGRRQEFRTQQKHPARSTQHQEPGTWNLEPRTSPVPGSQLPAPVPGTRHADPRDEERGTVRGTRHEARGTDAVFRTLHRWGLNTLGDLVALPRNELFARLGAEGVSWQRCARGEDARPLVPELEAVSFEESLELEWPIEGLEPLSFVLGRMLDPLCARLERHAAAAAVLHVRCVLVTREQHVRTLRLPAPLRDPRVLRTLILLDLESHPPMAGIDHVAITVDPAPARTVQCSLLERAVPPPEQLTTLLARLTALMGERQCGTPAVLDSHRPDAFEMRPFGSGGSGESGRSSGEQSSVVGRQSSVGQQSSASATAVLRRFRVPLAARVVVDRGRPVRVTTGTQGLGGGAVIRSAGPWRSSGEWWLSGARGSSGSSGSSGSTHPTHLSHPTYWNCDEWDVALGDGGVYRIYRDRAHGGWFLAGVMD